MDVEILVEISNISIVSVLAFTIFFFVFVIAGSFCLHLGNFDSYDDMLELGRRSALAGSSWTWVGWGPVQYQSFSAPWSQLMPGQGGEPLLQRDLHSAQNGGAIK